MSRFYGTIKGTRGEATRCGHGPSGMTAVAASHTGAVRSHVYVGPDDEDWADVSLSPWSGCGSNVLLYRGPVGGAGYSKDDDPHLGENVNGRLWVELAGADAKVVDIFKVMMALMHPYQLRELQDKLSRVGIEV